MAAPNTSFEFTIKPSRASRNAASDIRSQFNILPSTGASPTAPGQDRGDWESPSEAVWNCNFHHRFV